MHVFGEDDAPHGHMHLRFSDVRVPKDNILLGEGRGFEISQVRLGPGRIHHCMRSIGAAEKALELMVRRGLNREAFGKPLARLGKNTEMIAKARIEIEAMRLMVLRAAKAMDVMGNAEARVWVSAVKAMVPERVCQIIDEAIQIHGATGVSQWTPLARMYASPAHAAPRRRPRRGALARRRPRRAHPLRGRPRPRRRQGHRGRARRAILRTFLTGPRCLWRLERHRHRRAQFDVVDQTADEGDVGRTRMGHGDGDGVRADAHGDAERPQRRDPLGRQRRGGPRVGGDGSGPGCLARRQLDGQLVAADERHLEHPEQEHHHHRQCQRQLHGGLPGFVPSVAIDDERSSHLVDDGVDDPVEQPADLGCPSTRGRPADDEEGDECGGEQHECVLGGRLTAVTTEPPSPVGQHPFKVAVDSAAIYTANSEDSTISVIAGEPPKVVATIPAFADPVGLAVDPARATLYAGSWQLSGNDPVGAVLMIDTSSRSVSHTVTVASRPLDIAVDRATHRVYTTNFEGTVVSIIDPDTRAVTALAVEKPTWGVAVDPASGAAYVGCPNDNVVIAIDPRTRAMTSIAVGAGPAGLAIDQHTLYVAHRGENTLGVIDLRTGTKRSSPSEASRWASPWTR